MFWETADIVNNQQRKRDTGGFYRSLEDITRRVKIKCALYLKIYSK
jgi:hypothetical protein